MDTRPGRSNQDLERAIVLIQQGRSDLAERFLHDHLSGAPQDGHALALLSLVHLDRQRPRQALETALDAVEASPELPIAHYALSVASKDNGRHEAAVIAANEAIRLAPSASIGYVALATALFERRRWQEALGAADAGLAVDPEDKDLLRIRGLVQAHTGRRADAAATFQGALRLDPTDPGLLMGQGLAYLHENRPRDAATVFREALRVDPSNDAARAVLVEALKARNPIYGALLGGTLALWRLGRKATVALIVIWVVFQVIVRRMLADPTTERLALDIAYVYAAFVWFTFAAPSIFDLLLRLDPVGRDALSREQVLEANATGALVVLGVAAGLGAIVTTATPLVWLMIVALGLVIPLGNVYLVRPGKLRLAFTAYLVIAATLGLTAVVLRAIGTAAGDAARMAASETLFIAAAIMFVVATWIAWGTLRER
jgi:Flp pilus assembly protein TadD